MFRFVKEIDNIVSFVRWYFKKIIFGLWRIYCYFNIFCFIENRFIKCNLK